MGLKNKIIGFLLLKLSLRTKKILLVLLIIFGGLFAYGIYKFPFGASEGDFFVEKKEEPKEDTICPLTGILTTQEKADRRPFGIMVENHVSARPQSGLDKADLVYEVVTEGGITRFLAFYQCQDADEIGPVRSSRIYYLDWVAELAAFYAYAGGSPDSLARIYRDGVLGLKHSTRYFWRSRARPSPHNLYTSISKLEQYATNKKYDLKKSDFETWSFKDDPLLSQRPESFNFKINFSSYSYLVEYVYNKKTNDWTRKIAGKFDVDLKTGENIKVKNIIVQFSQIQPRGDSRVDVGTIGTGKALFFIDGKMTEGTWQKAAAAERSKYLDSNNIPVKFSPGPIWIEVVQIGTKIEY